MATVDTATPVERPPQMSANPVRRVAETWRPSGGGGASSPGAQRLQLRPHPPDRPRPAAAAARPLRGARADLQHAAAPHPVVFMLGPEANHFITVGHPENFHWRESSFGDLIPLLGDGLLTIDGDYHDRARAIMMPAFHREQIAAAVDGDGGETEAAIEALRPGEIGRRLRLDAQPGDADRDAGAARARSRRGRQGRRRGRALRARARLLRDRLPAAAAARPRLALAEADARRAPSSTRSSSPRSPAAAPPRPRAPRHPQPPGRGARRGRRGASPTARSATR